MTPITLSVTAYNERQRGDFVWIRECVTPAARHPLVSEIVVVNDGTDDIDGLRDALRDIPKVVVHQNAVNLGVFGNKVMSVRLAHNPWVIVCDSDNVMDADYFDRLQELHPWNSRVWYAASLAAPAFDYRSFIGDFTMGAICGLASSSYPDKRLWWCLINTGNWFVNRQQFVSTFDSVPVERFDLWQPDYFSAGERTDLHWRLIYDAQDSFYLNKLWIEAGGTLRVVDRLQYQHRVDSDVKGNYLRSPEEKEALAPIYYLELVDHARHQSLGRYRYLRRSNFCYVYRDEAAAGRVVMVDILNLSITSCAGGDVP